MTTNLHYPEPPHQGINQATDTLQSANGVAQGQTLTMPAPIPAQPSYDESPGEPAQYVVPAEYRRPFGETPRDKRGRFWTLAFASLASMIVSFIVLLTPFALYGINIVTAIAAIGMGIRALALLSKGPKTSFSGKAKTYSWLGIIGGAINLILSILAVVGLIAWFSYMENETCDTFSSYDSYHCQIGTNL